MRICVIQVPYAMGYEHHGGSKGAQRYEQAGVQQILESQGLTVTMKRVERGSPFRDTASASSAVNKGLAQLVRQAIATQQLPLVLAGSCDVSLGILAGFDHTRCGVIWVDAHADFNTPDSTGSGFFAGMSLAIITGHCYRNFWAQIGESSPIAEAATLLLGVRDLSPEAERERLHQSAIQVVNWHKGKPQADVLTHLDALTGRVQEIYLHIDLDAFDPQVAPGLVDPPVPGGLSMPQMEEIIRAATARFHIRAVALATYHRMKDSIEPHATQVVLKRNLFYPSDYYPSSRACSTIRDSTSDSIQFAFTRNFSNLALFTWAAPDFARRRLSLWKMAKSCVASRDNTTK